MTATENKRAAAPDPMLVSSSKPVPAAGTNPVSKPMPASERPEPCEGKGSTRAGWSRRTRFWAGGSLGFVFAATASLVTGFLGFTIDYYGDLCREASGAAGGLDGVFTRLLLACIGLGILAIIAGIVSVRYCGREEDAMTAGAGIAKGGSGRGLLHETWFDRIFAEILLCLGACAGAGIVPAVVLLDRWGQFSGCIRDVLCRNTGLAPEQVRQVILWNSSWGGSQQLSPNWVGLLLAILILCLNFAFCLLVIQSLAIKLKNRHFWRGTLLGWLTLKTLGLIRRDDKLCRKAFVIIICGVLLSMTWIGAAAVIVLSILFLPRYLDQFRAIREGASAIRNGDLEHRIPLLREDMSAGSEPGELEKLAEDINAISSAQSLAIQKELKTQKLRTDLITNVSHDLKTPLTSLVTYVDLLKTEGLDGEHAPEYLAVLDEKTQRLSRLSQDLFEAAKASSGDIPVDLQRLDMQAMVSQALAEFETSLSGREIETIVTDRTDSHWVMADSRHLWRVIENILSNLSKYAMPGTRAYLDLTADGDMLCLEVKNISQDPLNISAEDLMERFTRGEEARSGEGSGLGLAIARDLTQVLGGRFDLTIDGDLFKVSLRLPRA